MQEIVDYSIIHLEKQKTYYKVVYTWNLYNVINKYYLQKFNFKKTENNLNIQ